MIVKRLIPHVCIIISLLVLTFIILDNANPGMNFIGNGFFKALMIVFCLSALTAAGFMIADDRRKK